MDLHETVRCGAAWLDTQRPDWYTRLDCDHLDFNRWDRCVIGQVFGNPLCQPSPCSLRGDWLVQHGFDVEYAEGKASADVLHGHLVLTDLWRAEVKRRMTAEWPLPTG